MEGVAEPDESPALRMNLLLSSNRISLRSAVFIIYFSMPRCPSDRVHLCVVTVTVYYILIHAEVSE
jgi:hypothetical protein